MQSYIYIFIAKSMRRDDSRMKKKKKKKEKVYKGGMYVR